MSNPTTPTPTNGLAYAIMGVCATIVLAITVVIITGRDVTVLVQFALFLVPLLVMQIWTANRVQTNANTTAGIESQVNGALTTRLNTAVAEMKTHIDNATGTTPVTGVVATPPQTILGADVNKLA